MRVFIIVLVFAICLINTGCDTGKNCICTTSFSGTGSAGMVDIVEVIEPFDASTTPDCAGMDSVSEDANGLITTRTCVVE